MRKLKRQIAYEDSCKFKSIKIDTEAPTVFTCLLNNQTNKVALDVFFIEKSFFSKLKILINLFFALNNYFVET